MRQIPASGINLFQLIYILIRDYESKTAKNGEKVLNLSLGNPDLIPPQDLLDLKAEFQKKSDYELHTYAEDKNINSFCEGMVEAFAGISLAQHSELKAVPIAGIKTATALLPLACGLHLKRKEGKPFRMVTHLPAYDVAGTWGDAYLGGSRIVWPLKTSSGMKLVLEDLKSALKTAGVERPDLVWVIRPGNPASTGASKEEWAALCEFCSEHSIRLANDGAYTTLSSGSHTPLSQVAVNYPKLEWAELFSVSKAFSDPGARMGVIVGSKDFIEDFILVKGNTDSGPVPSIMAAYGEYFKDKNRVKAYFKELYGIYQARLDFVIPALKKAGLRQACATEAGFFTLWQVPGQALGKPMASSEAFNREMIERFGLVGVHFTTPSGEPLIRYAVCSDVLEPTFQKRFLEAISQIEPVYTQ